MNANKYYYVGMNDGHDTSDCYFILEIAENANLESITQEITKAYAEYKTDWNFKHDFFGNYDNLEEHELDELKEEYKNTCNMSEFYPVNRGDFPNDTPITLQEILNNEVLW